MFINRPVRRILFSELERLCYDLGEGLDALDRSEGRPLDVESIKQQGRQAKDGRNDY